MKIKYNNKQYDLLQFLKSKKFTVEKKLNAFISKENKLERLQRIFAVQYAWRSAEQVDIKKLYEYIGLIQTLYESVNYETNIDELKNATYYKAREAAYLATYISDYLYAFCDVDDAQSPLVQFIGDDIEERKIKLEMLINIVEMEKK